MVVMTLITWPMSALEVPSFVPIVLVTSAVFTASFATCVALVAFLEMSLIVADICSAPVATVCRFWLTWAVAVDTTLA